MVTDYQKIKKAIEHILDSGKKNFIIYPYGEYGVITKQILNHSFGIMEKYVVDNKLSQYNSEIQCLDYFQYLNTVEFTVLFTCANPDVYEEVRHNITKYFLESSIVDLCEDIRPGGQNEKHTICGKYSYGPLCNHWLVESVGAFCSFAPGSDVTENHPIQYISTHLFLYYGGDKDMIHKRWEELNGKPGYFPGVTPRGDNHEFKKIQIGNDVWLGKNVIITNSSNIGNGVIAGAGAVITKDVPDYPVVAGIPARIIRYRYTEEQIKALNKISWWNWTDERIRECHSDFYLDIEDFIQKFL